MIVVSDTTPLITLLKADQLVILEKLFGEVLVPEAVYSEVTSNETFYEEADEAFLKIKNANRHISDKLIESALKIIHHSE